MSLDNNIPNKIQTEELINNQYISEDKSGVAVIQHSQYKPSIF